MPKIEVGVSYGQYKNVDVFSVPDVEWDDMSETERQDYLDTAAADHRDNHVDCWATVVAEP